MTIINRLAARVAYEIGTTAYRVADRVALACAKFGFNRLNLTAGADASDHFGDTAKMVEIGSGARLNGRG